MAYIIDGERYTKAEVLEIIEDEYNPFTLACDYFDSSEPAIKVAETPGVGQGEVIRGLVAIGRISEDDVVRQFYTSLFRRLGKGETVDLYGTSVSYVPDRSGSNTVRPKSKVKSGVNTRYAAKGSSQRKPGKKPSSRSTSANRRTTPAKRNPSTKRRC